MDELPKTINRRDFLKIGALGAGLAGTAGATYLWAARDANDYYAKSGQENRVGHQFFDRSAFETDSVSEWEWKVVGPDLPNNRSVNGVHRIDLRWLFSYQWRTRLNATIDETQMCLPKAWPSNGLAGLDPFWQAYYTQYPMMVDRDKEYRYEWLPKFRERYFATQADRDKFNQNEGLLALAYSEAQRAPTIKQITALPEVNDWAGVSKRRAVFDSPEAASELIKQVGYNVGAALIRISPANPAWLWLNQSSDTRGYKAGQYVNPPGWWKYYITVGGIMDIDRNAGDPNYGDSWTGYDMSSQIAERLVAFLKYLGYPARWSTPFGGYDTVVPPIAAEGGFGQVGRTSNTIQPEFGGNCRPGVVITSLPMAIDKPIDFNLEGFCKRCKICAEVCPTQAISYADAPDMEMYGLRRYYTNHAKCNDGWSIGAGPMGCRACVSACPWTKKNTWVHRFVRNVLPYDKTGITQNIAVWAERNMYKKNAYEVLNPPAFMGVYNPPEYIKTSNYINSYKDTPMGVE